MRSSQQEFAEHAVRRFRTDRANPEDGDRGGQNGVAAEDGSS
jgi:hypothetical protein